MRLRLLLWLAALFIAVPSHAEEPLRLLVFGATGSVGSHIVDEALARGHLVTAVSRDPSSIALSHENLSAAEGDLLDRSSIAKLLPGHDVVISSVRGVIGDKSDPANALQLRSVHNIVAELRAIGDDAPRFLHVGGAGSLKVEPGKYFAEKLPKILLPKELESEIIAQIWALDDLRDVDDVRWTYVTPPIHLTNGKRTGEYRTGGDEVLRDGRGRSRLSKSDLAVAIIDEVEQTRHVNERFSVAY